MQLPLKNLSFPSWRSVILAVVIVALGVYFYAGRGGNSSPTLTIQPGDFAEQVSVSGTVIAAQDVDLGFAASGRIAGVYARVGDRVSAGDILAQTENGDLSATLLQKRAALAEASANLASLQAGTRPEEIAVALTAVQNAQSVLIDAIQSAFTTSDDAVRNKVDVFFSNPRTDPKLTFNVSNAVLKSVVESDRADIEPILNSWAMLVARLSSANVVDSAKQTQAYLTQVKILLADANAALNQGMADSTITAATLNSYATTLATARANVNAAAATLTTSSASLDSAQRNLTLKQAGPTSDDIASKTAAVTAAQAEVKNAEAALAKTYVVAPFTGRVTRMDAKVGEIVSPTTSLISMQSNGVFQIETYIPQVTIAGVAAGNKATTTLDAYGTSVAFSAAVVSVDPAETLKDGVPTYKTTLEFLSPDPRIRSGMTANVVITTGTLQGAIVIPSGAIGSRGGSPYVSVLVDGKAEPREVTTGISPALGQTQILSGLGRGDVILLTPVP